MLKNDLNQLCTVLKNELSDIQFVREIGVYRENLIYINIKNDFVYFALDIHKDKSIDLVFRDDDTQKIFSQYYGISFLRSNKIYKNDNFVDNIIQESMGIKKNHTSLVDTITFIIKSFIGIFIGQNSQFYSIRHEIQAIKDLLHLQNLNQILFDISHTYKNVLLSLEETLSLIEKNEMSIARFGDGEFKCMVTQEGHSFQQHNWQLMQELKDVSSKKHKNLLVCYPSAMVHNVFWNNFWLRNWAKIKPYMNQEILGDSFITRPEAFNYYGYAFAEKWRRIWDNKNICVVTGEGSRFDVDHYMFNNVNQVDFIFSKSVDAYEDINNIVNKCMRIKNIDMFIIALGMTGTVLAYRLHNLGYRALDVGHLPNSYDYVFKSAVRPEQLPIIKA